MILNVIKFTACTGILTTASGLALSFGRTLYHDFINYDDKNPFQSTSILANSIFSATGSMLNSSLSTTASIITNTYNWVEQIAPKIYEGIKTGVNGLGIMAREVGNMTGEVVDGTGERIKAIGSNTVGHLIGNKKAQTGELELDTSPHNLPKPEDQDNSKPTTQQPAATSSKPIETTQIPVAIPTTPIETTQQPATHLNSATKNILSQVNDKLKAVINSKPEYQNAYQISKDISVVLSPSQKSHIQAHENKLSILATMQFSDAIAQGALDSNLCSIAPSNKDELSTFIKNLGNFYLLQTYSNLADKISYSAAQLAAQESEEIKKLINAHKLLGDDLGKSIFINAKKLNGVDVNSKTVAYNSCELVNTIKSNNEITNLYSNISKEELSNSLTEMCNDSSFVNEPLCATIFDALLQ
jgi:hypothetical protein